LKNSKLAQTQFGSPAVQVQSGPQLQSIPA